MSRPFIALAALALSIACWPASAEDAATAAVAAASRAWDELYAAGDAARLAERYDEGAVSMPPGLPALSGKAALAADFKSFFASNRATHRTIDAERRIVGDLAVERARYEATISPKDGSPATTESGKHIVVYRRQDDGSWKVLWEIWNSDR